MDGYNENIDIVTGGPIETDEEIINYWLSFAEDIYKYVY